MATIKSTAEKSESPPVLTHGSWRKCGDKPAGMFVSGQPVALNGKLFIGGMIGRGPETVQVYTPDDDHWAKLPPPPVQWFTIATLKSQLLVVGGQDISTNKTSKAILVFDEHTQQWIESYPAMPTPLAHAAVSSYQDHLIVTSGRDANYIFRSDVYILDTINTWKTVPIPETKQSSLVPTQRPSKPSYCSALSKDTMYVVGRNIRTVLRAHASTLVSGNPNVWEALLNAPHHHSSPICFGNALLTVGGSSKPTWDGSPTTSIQMYNSNTNQWTKVGDIPEPTINPCCVIMNSELYVLGLSSVQVSKLTLLEF